MTPLFTAHRQRADELAAQLPDAQREATAAATERDKAESRWQASKSGGLNVSAVMYGHDEAQRRARVAYEAAVAAAEQTADALRDLVNAERTARMLADAPEALAAAQVAQDTLQAELAAHRQARLATAAGVEALRAQYADAVRVADAAQAADAAALAEAAAAGKAPPDGSKAAAALAQAQRLQRGVEAAQARAAEGDAREAVLREQVRDADRAVAFAGQVHGEAVWLGLLDAVLAPLAAAHPLPTVLDLRRAATQFLALPPDVQRARRVAMRGVLGALAKD